MAYSLEEEQEINKLKDWWQENGKTVVAAAILGIAAWGGWQYWQKHQINQIMTASMQYDSIVSATEQDPVAKKAQVEQFVQAHDKTSYAVFALFDEAKGLVNKQDFAGAENVLQQALAQSQDDVLTSLGALRLGAVQFQLGKFDDALASLTQVKNAAFEARKQLLIGDIQLAKADRDAAKAAFEAAQKAGNSAEQQMAELKLNSL